MRTQSMTLLCTILSAVPACSEIRSERRQTRLQGDAHPVVLAPEELPWTDHGSGVRVARLYGDSSRPGPFGLRVQYPPGFRKEPHHHPFDAHITVLSGSYYRGYGSVFDESRGHQLTPGSFSINPKGLSHYEWTREAVVLELHATGPWTSTYVNERGAPVAGNPAGGH